MQTFEQQMAAAEATEPDQDAEDPSSLFFCSRFFPEPNVLYPIFPHTCWGRKCPEWGGGFFSLIFFFLNEGYGKRGIGSYTDK